MKWIKRLSLALAVLLVLAVAAPFFVSLNDYIPRIEQAASARLKESVTIKSIKLGMLPVLHVSVDGIAVGRTQDVTLGKVTVTPDVFSLLAATKVIKSIELKSLVLTRKGLDKIPGWTKADGAQPPAQPPAIRIESLRLDDALIKLDKTTFGPFDARVTLDGKGAPIDAVITTQDGKLKVSVKPDKSNYLIDATAKAWRLPAGPAILFDDLAVKGVATPNRADFSHVSARLYGGTVNGRASIAWQKGLQVRGDAEIRQIELKSLAPLVAPGTNISGRLNAKPVFSASSADAGQLLNALHLETPFNVQNGVLHGIDIQKAATSLVKQGATGGETRFEQLSGNLVRDRGAHQFTQLRISSGALAADGNVNISAKQELSGRVNAQVKAAGASVGVPLNVAGTVQSPLLYPTGGTMAGAAIGTVLLPGVGTGLGASAGQAIENLFGKKEEPPPARKK
jgi:uncharacterized protein involved in outer membrane biogenesis